MTFNRVSLVTGFTILLGATLLGVAFYFIITPDIYQQTSPTHKIAYVFLPDDDEYSGKKHLLQISVWSNSNAGIADVRVHYRKKTETEFQNLSFVNLENSNLFFAQLPTLPKGQRYFYYLEIRDEIGNSVRIPSHAPAKPLLHITYEDKVNKFMLIIHIVLVVGAVFFLLHSLHYAISILAGLSVATGKIIASMFLGWLSFLLGAIVIGFYIAYKAFGIGWSGIPVGDDITDNKSVLMILYWGTPLLLWKLQRLSSPKTLSFWVVGGAILTLIIYLIPHSIFLQ